MTNTPAPWSPKPAPSSTPASIGPMSAPMPATNVPAHPAEAAPVIPAEVIARLKAKNYPQDHIGVMMLWDEVKKTIVAATVDEMFLRKIAVKATFTAPAEGTNRQSIGNGMDAKAVVKYTYTLKSPDEKRNVIDAVDDTIDNMRKISNEGVFIAERIFKWSCDISVAEYRKLVEDAKDDPTAAKLFAEVQKVLRVAEAAPTLEIVPAKKGGK